MTGYDLPLSPNLIAGAALTWNHLSTTYALDTGTSSTRSSGLSLYGRFGEGNAYVTGRVGQDWLTSDINRWALLGDAIDTIASQRDDTMTFLYGETGYHLTFATASLIPFASLGYNLLHRGAINEAGAGGFGLMAHSEGFDQTDGQVGARLTHDWLWSGGRTYVSGYALYQRVFSGDDLAFHAAYAGASTATFSVEGVNSPRNSAWAGLGVTTQLRRGWSWFLNLDGQVAGGDTNTRVVSAGVRLSL
jgi:outer membrane autotransporter protein